MSDLVGAVWRKSTYSAVNGCVEAAWLQSIRCGNGNCVEVAFVRPGRCETDGCVEVEFADGLVAVRDSKDPQGQALVFTPLEWQAFIDGVRDGQFDPP
jgi:hypothetical protein